MCSRHRPTLCIQSASTALSTSHRAHVKCWRMFGTLAAMCSLSCCSWGRIFHRFLDATHLPSCSAVCPEAATSAGKSGQMVGAHDLEGVRPWHVRNSSVNYRRAHDDVYQCLTFGDLLKLTLMQFFRFC